MTKASKSTMKIGPVTVTRISSDKWKLRFTEEGRDVRRNLAGLHEDEVHRIAFHIGQQLLSGKGFLNSQNRAPLITEAIEDCIRLSGRRDYVKQDTASRAALFVKWLNRAYPAVVRMDQLKPFHLIEYVRQMEQDGLKYDSIRLRLAPLKMAWKFTLHNYPGTVEPLPPIKITVAPPREIQGLDAGGLMVLLDWMKPRRLDLWAIATLQGLAGLRVLEACYLRRQDIDFQRGLVTVTNTEEHQLKNRGSERVLPVCSEVLQALDAHLNTLKVMDTSGYLFRTKQGLSWNPENFGHRMTALLKKCAAETSTPEIGSIKPHHLRATFASHAVRLGVPQYIVQAYLGHTGQTVLERHYQRVTVDDLRLVACQFEAWRKSVSGVFPGNILATSSEDMVVSL